MKRSVLMSALVLALAAAMPACASSGAATDAPAKDGDAPKKEDEGTGDPLMDLKNISEGIQKDIDALFDPIRNADAVIDSIAALPKELKAMKSKVEPKKLMAEAQKILNGEDPALDALNLEADAKAKVTDRFDKLKALVVSVKTMDDKVKILGDRITDAATKVPALGAKVIGKAQVKIKAPFGVSAEDKKKAEQDMKDVEGIVNSFKDKANIWRKDLTDLPVKAKDLPAKMAKTFK